MKKYLCSLLTLIAISFSVQAEDGMIHIQSAHSVEQTQQRLEAILKTKGMTVFNQINHAENAAKVGKTLRDTRLVIFGNPKVGSPLMACQQSIALDLPQKALIWEDDKKTVWLSYNDPAYLKDRHKVEGCDPVFAKVTKALSGILGAAAKAE